MCDVCRVFGHKYEFDCPMVTEWPDHPWDKETRIRETHDAARFRRENPELAKRTMDKVAKKVEECDHPDYSHRPEDWQGVTVVVMTCDHCGATKNLFQDW